MVYFYITIRKMATKINKFEAQQDWPHFVGQVIAKRSGKTFKSGEKHGVAVSLTTNPHTGKEAFLMDDESIVDCYQCKLATTTDKLLS